MEQAIETSVILQAPVGRVRRVLAEDPGIVVAAAGEGTRRSRFQAVLSLDLGAGAAVQQEVIATVGPAAAAGGGFVLPLSWRPVGHERVFPSFVGEVVVSEARPGTVLVLRGTYTVPLGWVGRLGDAVAGRRLAHRVLTTHMDAVAQRLGEAVARQAASVGEYPIDAALDGLTVSAENFIG